MCRNSKDGNAKQKHAKRLTCASQLRITKTYVYIYIIICIYIYTYVNLPTKCHKAQGLTNCACSQLTAVEQHCDGVDCTRWPVCQDSSSRCWQDHQRTTKECSYGDSQQIPHYTRSMAKICKRNQSYGHVWAMLTSVFARLAERNKLTMEDV